MRIIGRCAACALRAAKALSERGGTMPDKERVRLTQLTSKGG